MYEDDFSSAWKRQIAAACQIPAMKPVSVALAVSIFCISSSGAVFFLFTACMVRRRVAGVSMLTRSGVSLLLPIDVARHHRAGCVLCVQCRSHDD